ncbi:MAG: hypothetical protein ABSD88_04040 [Candidatus Korobacteraceae bacterium]|jgi:hypothetical protein
MENSRTYDAKTKAQRRGSVALAVGWTLLAMAMLVGIYVFQDIREGTHFFIAYAGVMAFIGVMAIGYGQHLRSANG